MLREDLPRPPSSNYLISLYQASPDQYERLQEEPIQKLIVRAGLEGLQNFQRNSPAKRLARYINIGQPYG